MIKYLETNFDEAISNKKILVDFYADWCGPCRMLGSVLENINDIEILKVNIRISLKDIWLWVFQLYY